MPAAAQGDMLLAGWQRELIAQVIDDLYRTLQDEGAVLSAADHERVGHGAHLRLELGSSGRALHRVSGTWKVYIFPETPAAARRP